MIENFLAEALCGYLKDKLWEINAAEPQELQKPYPGALNTRMMLTETASSPISEEPVRIKVFNGYLPPREHGEAQYPFASVILLSGEISTEQMSLCRTLISLGVYADDHSGHKDLLNLIRRTSNALLTLPDLTLNRRYVLSGPLKWSISQDDLDPFWLGSITAEWQFYAPQFPYQSY